MDWHALLSEVPGTTAVPAGPGENGSSPGMSTCPESSIGADFSHAVPVVPVVPVKNQRGDDKTLGWGVAASDIRGNKTGENLYQIDPSAVCLILAFCAKVCADDNDVAIALAGLRTTPPAEQIKQWHTACLEKGISPQHVIYQPSPGKGAECTGCRHLQMVKNQVTSSPRVFHWSCKHGYLILEGGQHFERVLIAPEECKDRE